MTTYKDIAQQIDIYKNTMHDNTNAFVKAVDSFLAKDIHYDKIAKLHENEKITGKSHSFAMYTYNYYLDMIVLENF